MRNSMWSLLRRRRPWLWRACWTSFWVRRGRRWLVVYRWGIDFDGRMGVLQAYWVKLSWWLWISQCWLFIVKSGDWAQEYYWLSLFKLKLRMLMKKKKAMSWGWQGPHIYMNQRNNRVISVSFTTKNDALLTPTSTFSLLMLPHPPDFPARQANSDK